MSILSRSAPGHDASTLLARAQHGRARRERAARRATRLSEFLLSGARQLVRSPGELASRSQLHLLLALIVSSAILASQLPIAVPAYVVAPIAQSSPGDASDLVVPGAPLPIDPGLDEQPVSDSAFAAIDALQAAAWRQELLRYQPIEAAVAADKANVRSGPGTDYDTLSELPSSTPLKLLAQANGWYQARLENRQIVWVAAELLQLPARAAESVPETRDVPAPPPARIGLVAQDALKLRDGPGTAYVGMTTLALGAQLDLLARYGDWFQVQSNESRVGWVLGEYLALAPGVAERVEAVAAVPSPNPDLIGRTSARNVNLRAGPGTDYAQMGRLGAGVQLALLGRYQDWLKVRTSEGASGWISSELISVDDFVARRVQLVRDIPAPPRREPVASASARQSLPVAGASASGIVAYATQFVGARYVWGGASPEGFDCSGFTQYVYKQFGLSLPHSSVGQYSSQYGTIVSNPSDLLPGDIVFFANTYKRGISHVGIYSGGGDVVQALSPKQGVGIANLNGGYWAAHYYGAIRPAR